MEDEEADVVGTISADVLLEVTILRDTKNFYFILNYSE